MLDSMGVFLTVLHKAHLLSYWFHTNLGWKYLGINEDIYLECLHSKDIPNGLEWFTSSDLSPKPVVFRPQYIKFFGTLAKDIDC